MPDFTVPNLGTILRDNGFTAPQSVLAPVPPDGRTPAEIDKANHERAYKANTSDTKFIGERTDTTPKVTMPTDNAAEFQKQEDNGKLVRGKDGRSALAYHPDYAYNHGYLSVNEAGATVKMTPVPATKDAQQALEITVIGADGKEREKFRLPLNENYATLMVEGNGAGIKMDLSGFDGTKLKLGTDGLTVRMLSPAEVIVGKTRNVGVEVLHHLRSSPNKLVIADGAQSKLDEVKAVNYSKDLAFAATGVKGNKLTFKNDVSVALPQDAQNEGMAYKSEIIIKQGKSTVTVPANATPEDLEKAILNGQIEALNKEKKRLETPPPAPPPKGPSL